jgi:hypothetical protein
LIERRYFLKQVSIAVQCEELVHRTNDEKDLMMMVDGREELLVSMQADGDERVVARIISSLFLARFLAFSKQ